MARTKGAYGNKSMTGNKEKRVELRLTREQLRALDLVAEAWDKSRSDIICKALAAFFRGSYIPGGLPFSLQDVNEIFPD